MVKAIDWRLRPPFGTFRNAQSYKNVSEKHPMSARQFNMDLLIEEMDAAGVAVGVVPVRKGGDNDDIRKIKEAYPGRFKGLAHIDPWDGAKALEDIDRYVAEGAADGIIIEPGQFFIREPLAADDKMLYPIYEKCEKENILTTITFGGLYCAKLEYYNPIFIDRVACDFPNLKIVLNHGGWPYITEICHVAYQRKNVYLDADYYLMKFNPGWQDYVTAANNLLQDQIIWGSCFPAVHLDVAVNNCLNIGLTPEATEKVLYKNAAKLLGITE